MGEPRAEPGFEKRVEENFARQEVMKLLGARLGTIEPGRVSIRLPFDPRHAQQRGFVHAGILATIVDSAGGYAAYTYMPAGSDVLTVEFKLNFLAPGLGEEFEAVGKVVRAGRTLTVCELSVDAIRGSERTRCVHGTQTLFCSREGRPPATKPEAAAGMKRRA